MTTESKRTDQAIRHLKTIKPYDGWSADTYLNSQGKQLVMLRRRNVPLSSTGYTAIAYDENDSKCVIGIKSYIGETGKTAFCRGVVLVEKDGSVARDQRDIRVSLKNSENTNTKEQELKNVREQNRKDLERAREATRRREGGTGGAAAAATGSAFIAENIMATLSDSLTNENTSETAKLGLIFICVVSLLKIVASFRFAFKAIVLPLGIMYAMQNCPSNDTFDAKKELKRVLRG